MSTTTGGKPERDAKRVQWETWARQKIAGSEEQIQAAVDGAMRAVLNGATSQEAAAAGKAAAANYVAPELRRPAPTGAIVGYARRVQRNQQLTGSGALQTLEFQLERSDGRPIQVQMRGVLLDGVITEGDVVEVPVSGLRGGFLQTDYVYNRSSNSEIRMRTGMSGLTGVVEAQWGPRWKRWPIIVGLGFLAFIISGVVALIVFMTVAGNSMDDEHDQFQQQWCEDARQTGWQDPPGC